VFADKWLRSEGNTCFVNLTPFLGVCIFVYFDVINVLFDFLIDHGFCFGTILWME
jgi:hypothetical protein